MENCRKDLPNRYENEPNIHRYEAEDYILSGNSESPMRSGTTYHDEHSTLKKSKKSVGQHNQFDQNRGTAGFGASQASVSKS